MASFSPTGILFVCLGNICRSPTAEGVFAHKVDDAGLSDRIRVDSCGTRDYHPGQRPDPRSCEVAAQRGYHFDHLRARVICRSDFEEFDYILAMDESNLRDVLARCPSNRRDRVRLFMSFAPELGEVAVPDPYYGGGSGFDTVLDLVEAASDGLIEHLRNEWSG
ncbi:MAG: low molecular weight protein-tyrosine-phosphatase [Planctomycetota bacterium]|nr:low molecular weight protein-tyrosine-phosphatase [Planctomycetota bacterium]